VDEVGGEDLDTDEGEDERDRFAQVPEAAHKDVDQGEQGTKPEERESVRRPDHAGSRVTANAAGIESTANAMSATMIAITTSSNGVP